MNARIAYVILFFLILSGSSNFSQENKQGPDREEILRPAKGFVTVNGAKIPIFPGVKEVSVTTHSNGRVHLMYRTSFSDMAMADRHFAKLGKFYENRDLFVFKVPKLKHTPPYAYSFEICNAEINEQGDVASVRITIDVLGHGYGAYVFVDNYCE